MLVLRTIPLWGQELGDIQTVTRWQIRLKHQRYCPRPQSVHQCRLAAVIRLRPIRLDGPTPEIAFARPHSLEGQLKATLILAAKLYFLLTLERKLGLFSGRNIANEISIGPEHELRCLEVIGRVNHVIHRSSGA